MEVVSVLIFCAFPTLSLPDGFAAKIRSAFRPSTDFLTCWPKATPRNLSFCDRCATVQMSRSMSAEHNQNA
jgi:hypothetical protein